MKEVKRRKTKEFHRSQNQFNKNRMYIKYKKNKKRKSKECQSNQRKGKIAFFVLSAFVLTTMIMIFCSQHSLNNLKEPKAVTVEAKIIVNHQISANNYG